MKRLITILAGIAITFAMAGLAEASPTVISFADSIQGVDAPTGWSVNNSTAGPLSTS